MSRADRKSINDEEWMTIRDFDTDAEGNTLPRYEAKFVEEMDKSYIENEIVLVKETSSFGSERMYHVPRAVVEDVSDLIPK
jgi:hypothetical protein